MVTVRAGYVKRVPPNLSRPAPRRQGRAGMDPRRDFFPRLFVASTHTPVLFFSKGQVYKEKVWRCRWRPNARQGADQHPAGAG